MKSAKPTARRHRPAAVLACIALFAVAGYALAAVDAPPAPAELEHRYPKGSIRTAADAQHALSDAAAAEKTLDDRYASERVRCARVFLATQCLDSARRVHSQGSALVHRIEVEAHDLQRQQAADERRVHRESDQARQHADDAQRTDPSHKPAPTQKKGEGVSAAEAAQQQAQALASRERFEKRNAEHDRDQAKSAEIQIRKSPENARRYQDKQARAKAYAADRAREREDNEKNRAERERERKKKFEDPASDPPTAPAPK